VDVIREKFSDCGKTACFGKFSDMGGLEGNYFSPEQYSFTLERKSAGKLSVVLKNIDLAAKDTLAFYEGKDVNGTPLAKLYSSQSSKVVTSSGDALTVRFTSSSLNPSEGWEATWNCGESLPSDSLKLTRNLIDENLPTGTFIGRFLINGSRFSVLNDAQSGNNLDNSDNANFRISGDSLFSSSIFNYEKKKFLSVDGSGNGFTSQEHWNSFVISVVNKNDPPVFLNQLPILQVKLGESFQYQLPTNLVTDEDGDMLSFGSKEQMD